MGYSVVHIDELEPSGPGGAIRFVRRELGVEAFGINWFELPPNAEGREHDESETGHEAVKSAPGRAATKQGVRSDRLRPVYASAMTTIELTPDEAQLMRSALQAFLDDFGHEEMDVIRRIQALLAKLPEESPPPSA